MKKTIVIVESKQNRPHDLATFLKLLTIAEAADDAVGAAVPFDLLHASAVAGLVGEIEPLRNHAIASGPCRRQPTVGVLASCAGRRKSKEAIRQKMFCGELFEERPPFGKRAEGELESAPLEQVECKEDGGGRFGQLPHTACRGVNALQQI